jgi:hypothetical protein
MSTESLTATAQRMARATGRIDHRQRDLKTDRVADRIVPVFELMARRGQITAQQATAGQTYAGYWHGSRRNPGLVGAYGDQRWSGTSAGQSATGSLMTEEWPIYCGQQLAASNAAIGDRDMAKVLERIVELDATLEDVGREFLGYKSTQQAMAAGAAVAKIALQRLANFYGYCRSGEP